MNVKNGKENWFLFFRLQVNNYLIGPFYVGPNLMLVLIPLDKRLAWLSENL